MIFLVDENFPGNTIAPLEQLAQSRHQFLKAGRDYPHGISDLELFSTAAAMNADVLITADIRQIQGQDRRHERDACRSAGIHWVGVPRHPQARGRRIAHLQLATFVSALEPIVREVENASEPRAFLLRSGSLAVPFQDGFPQVL